jgi:hypothetical protein
MLLPVQSLSIEEITRLTCSTKCGVGMGSAQSLQRSESTSGCVCQECQGGVSKTSQLPASSVPLKAANAAASNPCPASKTA